MSGTPRKFDKRNRQRRAEYEKEQLHEKLAAFEELEGTVLPMLAKLLASGATSAEMRKHMAPYMTARAISIALTDKDTGKAMTAIRDLVDRDEGKAKERIENTHKFEKLPDQELDAILDSALAEEAQRNGQQTENH